MAKAKSLIEAAAPAADRTWNANSSLPTTESWQNVGLSIQQVNTALGVLAQRHKPPQVKVVAQPTGARSVVCRSGASSISTTTIHVQKVKWGGIGWDCAWSEPELTLYVCADSAIIQAHFQALGVLAGLAAVNGGLGPVIAKADQLYEQNFGQVTSAVTEKSFNKPRTTKDAARQIVTTAVSQAIGMGLTMQEIRLAVLSALGLDSENDTR